jgi:acetyl-CoA synthetase
MACIRITSHILRPERPNYIICFAPRKLGSAVAPKDLAFQDNLPKNKAGKIMRRLLKARELGLPEGDTSTLETNA